MRTKKTRRKTRSVSKPTPLGVFQTLLFGVVFYLTSLMSSNTINGQQVNGQQLPNVSSPLPFRPIGSGSNVDRYDRSQSASSQQVQSDQRPASNGQFRTVGHSFRETGYQNRDVRQGSVRQVAMQGGFALPPQGGGVAGQVAPGTFVPPSTFSPPPLNMPPALSQAPLQPAPAPSFSPQPQTVSPLPATPSIDPRNTFGSSAGSSAGVAPRSLPNFQSGPAFQNSTNFQNGPMADYQPVAPPQIANGGFATMGDCRLITPPSSYTSMSPYGNAGCGCGVAPASYAGPYVPPQAQIAAPAMMPPAGFAPVNPQGSFGAPIGAAPNTAAPVGSLMTFGQENYPVQVGQGLWGQPVAYVPGQRVRNWLRYFSF